MVFFSTSSKICGFLFLGTVFVKNFEVFGGFICLKPLINFGKTSVIPKLPKIFVQVHLNTCLCLSRFW